MIFTSQDLAHSILFKAFPPWDHLEYQGAADSGIQILEMAYEGKTRRVAVSHIIRREEELVWKGCREMLEFALKQAASSIQGFFGFDLLTLEFDENMRHFQPSNLAQLLVNHSKKMQPGETRLIQYASLLALFKKRIPESWGKIDFKSPVRLFSEEPSKLDLFIKKMRKSAPDSILIINDLSADPIFRFGEEDQTARLAKWLQKESQSGMLPEIFMVSKKNNVELGAQFGVRS